MDLPLAISRRGINLSPIFDMRQFLTIATNAFMELIRQPVFLLLMTASVLFEIFLAVPYYFALGDDMKLVSTSALAVMLLSGLLASWMSFDAYGKTNLPALGIFAAGVIVAYALAGFSNFFLRRPFVSDAVLALVVTMTLAAFLVFQFVRQMQTRSE